RHEFRNPVRPIRCDLAPGVKGRYTGIRNGEHIIELAPNATDDDFAHEAYHALQVDQDWDGNDRAYLEAWTDWLLPRLRAAGFTFDETAEGIYQLLHTNPAAHAIYRESHTSSRSRPHDRRRTREGRPRCDPNERPTHQSPLFGEGEHRTWDPDRNP